MARGKSYVGDQTDHGVAAHGDGFAEDRVGLHLSVTHLPRVKIGGIL
jgi:hypothetical protein